MLYIYNEDKRLNITGEPGIQGHSQGDPLGPYFKHVNEEKILTPGCIL